MKRTPEWASQDKQFWAYVRVLSEAIGYTNRRNKAVRIYSHAEMAAALTKLGRDPRVLARDGLGDKLANYSAFRADLLNTTVHDNLMTAEQASALLEEKVLSHVVESTPLLNQAKEESAWLLTFDNGAHIRLPMNKQKGDKRAPSFFTGIVNGLVALELGGDRPFEDDPARLPAIDKDGELWVAMSRRMDGAYPSSINPVALWEIKEYYYTTTFGSKISDSLYVTQLDGYELKEIEAAVGRPVPMYLFVDAYGAWWNQGRSYLCRMVDLLEQGVLDEVIVGREAVHRIPELVPQWTAVADTNREPD